MNLFDLSGDVAAVVGGTGTLGGAIAEALAEAGAKVAVLGRNGERGEACVRRIATRGGKAKFFSTDAMSRESLRHAHDEIQKTFGAPTILVNAAGGNDPKVIISAERKVEQIALADWQANFDLNLVGGVLLPCQEFGPGMVARGGGSIINIASVSARIPLSRVVAYSAAKAAVLNLTQFLAREWAAANVRVNAIDAGIFSGRAKPADAVQRGRLADGARGIDLGHTPMGRFGKPEELVGAAIFLASAKASSFVTGSECAWTADFWRRRFERGRLAGGFLARINYTSASEQTISQTAPPGGALNESQVAEVLSQACPAKNYRGKKILFDRAGRHAHGADGPDVPDFAPADRRRDRKRSTCSSRSARIRR